jgi:hypothetical protein
VCAWEVELQRDGGIKVTALSRERRKYAAYGASRGSKWEMVEPSGAKDLARTISNSPDPHSKQAAEQNGGLAMRIQGCAYLCVSSSSPCSAFS